VKSRLGDSGNKGAEATNWCSLDLKKSIKDCRIASAFMLVLLKENMVIFANL
jgi:hypothetical protein